MIVSVTGHCELKWILVQSEKGLIDGEWFYEILNSDAVPLGRTFQLLTQLIRMGITCVYEIQYNGALWVKLNVSPSWKWWWMGSNAMKLRITSHSGTLGRTFNHLTKLVFERELHVFMKFSIYRILSKNACYSHKINSERWGVMPWNTE